LHGCEYVIETCERWGFYCFPVDGETKVPMMCDYLNRAQEGETPAFGMVPVRTPFDQQLMDGKLPEPQGDDEFGT
jgi:hypothetical protein